MKSNYELYLEKSRFLNLDGLRGISIILVIWHHAEHFTNVALGYGFLGVDLFFIISGFLIVTLLLREKRKSGDVSLKSFYIRRFLRIFPLYYASLFLIVIFALFLGSATIFSSISADFPKSFFYVSNWFPMVSMLSITWSLSAEEQFYCVWPWLEKYGKDMIVLLLISLLSIFIGIQVLHGQFGLFADLPHFLLETSFTPIFLGVGLAHILNSEKYFNLVAPVLCSPWALLSIGLVLSSLIGLSIKDISGLPRLIFHLCFTLILAIVILKEQSSLGSFLQWKPLARIGMISYGMYLLHLIAMHIVSKIIGLFHIDFILSKFIFTFFLTWVFAEISYRYYETPFLNLKNRWNPSLRNSKSEGI